MERKKIAEAALREILISEMTKVLGRDASFLGNKILIRRRERKPNWDANCGIAGTIVIKAFVIELNKAQAQYDLV